MKKNIALILLLILVGCSSEQPEPKNETARQEPPMATQISLAQKKQAPFTSISAQTAQKLMADKPDLLILDVRTTKEILTYGAIAGSRQTSLRPIFQNELTMAKDTPILLVCAVGGRSYAAGQIMVKYGFQEIYNLRGGLDEWKKAALPVIYPKE